MTKDPNIYPPGWNRKRVEAVIAYYENQSEDQEAEEIERAYASPGCATVEVPNELLPAINSLISHYEALKQALPRPAGRRKVRKPA